MKNKILILIALFIFTECKNKSITADINKALLDVTTKFPQLPKGGVEHYLLEKSVKNAKYKYEIQLYSETDKIIDPQKILVFINAENECFAIPFFSNTYRDFWEFKNEIPLPKIKKVQTTFSKEYFEALVKLKLNKIEVYFSVTNDLLISILNCDKISKCDYSDLKNHIFSNNNYALDSEDNYELLKQNRAKNDEEILKTTNWEMDDDDVQQYVGCMDYKNFRFYQVVLKVEILDASKNPIKIIQSENELQIKSYRKDRIIHLLGSDF